MEVIHVSANETKKILFTKPGEYRVILEGKGAEVIIGALLETTKTAQESLEVEIIHRAPHTTATTVMKATAAGTALAKLIGTIIVEPSAVGTNSFLRQNMLLLSETAKAEAVPNLEIKTNDVKCSHAATVAPLDSDQLFYLACRGLETAEATKLIVTGFVDEVYALTGHFDSATIEAR